MAEDGSSLSFRVREGVTWHDGTPVTADDVVWTYEMSVDPDIAFANAPYFQYVTRAVKVDDRTVRFEFSEPHSDAPMDFTEWSLMPSHLLKDIPGHGDAKRPVQPQPGRQRPVPLRVVAIEPAGRLRGQPRLRLRPAAPRPHRRPDHPRADDRADRAPDRGRRLHAGGPSRRDAPRRGERRPLRDHLSRPARTRSSPGTPATRCSRAPRCGAR